MVQSYATTEGTINVALLPIIGGFEVREICFKVMRQVTEFIKKTNKPLS